MNLSLGGADAHTPTMCNAMVDKRWLCNDHVHPVIVQGLSRPKKRNSGNQPNNAILKGNKVDLYKKA
jgi:hypothetical protein